MATELRTQDQRLNHEGIEMLDEIIYRLGWTLLHTTWQFALVALVCGTLNQLLFARSAQRRYACIATSLVIVSTLPILTYLSLPEQPRPTRSETPVASVVNRKTDDGANEQSTAPRNKIDLSALPFTFNKSATPTSNAQNESELDLSAEETATVEADATRPDLRSRWVAHLESHLPTFVVAWLLGVVLLSVRPGLGYYSVVRLRRHGRVTASREIVNTVKRLANSLGISSYVEVSLSTMVEVPTVIGQFRPLLLLPVSVVSGLTPHEVEALVAHELAHVRRYDFLVNVVQTLLETVFFYHPAVWWLSARLRREREHCTDDRALAVFPFRKVYAGALVALEGLRGPAVPALSANGGELLQRVRRIARGEQSNRRAFGTTLAVLVVVLAVAALGIALRERPAQADESDADKKRQATTSLRSGDRVYWIGENIPLHLGITNTGDSPFNVEEGGDYRGGPRPLRFKVVALNENGQRVPDPYGSIPVSRPHGGMSQMHSVKPGKTHWLFLPLARYCDFREPGTYTVRVYHDLGWNDDLPLKDLVKNELPTADDTQHLIAATTIRIAQPDAERAKAIVDEMAASLRSKRRESSYWEDGVDFMSLRAPCFLSHLRALQLDVSATVARAARRTLLQLKSQERIPHTHFSPSEFEMWTAEHDVAWGNSKSGLQLGLSLISSTDQFAEDQRIPLAVLLRNTSDAPISVNVLANFYWMVPTILNRQNDAMKLERFYVNGVVADTYHRPTLAPGAVLGLRHHGIGLGDSPVEDRLAPFAHYPYWKNPVLGRHSIIHTHDVRIQAGALDDTKPDEALRLSTGSIDVEIVAPQKPRLPAGTGAVEGRLNFPGPLPTLPPLKIPGPETKPLRKNATAEERIAYQQSLVTLPDGSLTVGPDGGLANALVYLESPPVDWQPAASPKPPVQFDVTNAKIVPRVAVVQTKQDIVVRNKGDAVTNIRTSPLRADERNQQIVARQELRLTAPYSQAESAPHAIRSDVHPWKQGHILVVDHPFAAVTDREGRFRIAGLPPGEYTFRIWHERVGFLPSLQVTIRSDKTLGVARAVQPDKFLPDSKTSAARLDKIPLPDRKAATVSRYGGIMPSFDEETATWFASDIIEVRGQNMDGIFVVQDVWRGSLKAGDEILLPELRLFSAPETRVIQDHFRRDKSHRYVSGKRMLLFLSRNANGQWLSAAMHGQHRHAIDFSVAWIEGKHVYAVQQPRNPGPNCLVSLPGELTDLRRQVTKLLSVRDQLESLNELTDATRRAKSLKAFACGDLWHARQEAFRQLAACQENAVPVLEEIIRDVQQERVHGHAIRCLRSAVGDAANARLIELLKEETDYWQKVAPQLKEGWWNDSTTPNQASLRTRYSRLIAIIRALHERPTSAAQDALIQLRDFWSSLPQLNDRSGLNQIIEETSRTIDILQFSAALQAADTTRVKSFLETMNPNTPLIAGKRPLQLAIQAESQECVRLLLEHGASPQNLFLDKATQKRPSVVNLQGTWQVVGMVFHGEVQDFGEYTGGRMKLTPETIFRSLTGNQFVKNGHRYTATRQAGERPNPIDIYFEFAKHKGVANAGIWHLDDNVLLFARPEKPTIARPTSFAVRDSRDVTLFLMHRINKES